MADCISHDAAYPPKLSSEDRPLIMPTCACEPPAHPPVLPSPLLACLGHVDGRFDFRQPASAVLMSALKDDHGALLRRVRMLGPLHLRDDLVAMRPMDDGTSVALVLLKDGNSDAALDAVSSFGHCGGAAGFSEERYTVMSRASFVFAGAPSIVGMHSAIATLEQLLDRSPHFLPSLYIADAPAYRWRGMHLDVARHFFSVETLQAFIPQLGRLKFNVVHLHLTDDQGWRLHVPELPRLTEVGARRGGFYDAADIAGLVALCETYGIQLVPEMMHLRAQPWTSPCKWSKDWQI